MRFLYSGFCVFLQVIAGVCAFCYSDWHWVVTIGFLGVLIVLLCSFADDSVVYKTSVSLTILIAVTTIVLLCFDVFGLSVHSIGSYLDEFRGFLTKNLVWGVVIYSFVVVLHTVVIPISTVPIVLLGVAVFGANITFVATTTATILGSILAFVLGKICGRPLIVWLVGKEKFDKYNDKIKHSGKYYLAAMFLLPVFPDDILCMLAGSSTMGYGEFCIITILTRPPMIAFTCYVGTGDIIPFSGWGIPVWIGIVLVFVGIFVGMHLFAKSRKRA